MVSIRHHFLRCLLVAVAASAVGCTVRDEAAAPAVDGQWWATASARPQGGGLIAAGPTTPATAPAIDYVDGFDAGSRRASESGQPMLVVFRAAWCRWSGELVQGAVADPAVVRLSRRFVCVAVDADRHADACRKFGVNAFPTVILLDADGTERFRATGATAITHVAAAMNDVAATPARPKRIATTPAAPVR
jgi:hypothetical protein